LSTAERDLENVVQDLVRRKRIIGTTLTLEEMLNPLEENEVGESTYQFEHGDDEIIAKVNHEMAVQQGEIVEVESDKDDEAENGTPMGLGEMVRITEQMEGICISHGTKDMALDLARRLRQFRIELRRQEQAALTQPTLRRFWAT
jgi:hypothetical protein